MTQRGVFEHGQRVRQLAADPKVSGDLLAVGVAMSAIIDAGLGELSFRGIQELAFGADSSALRAKVVLRDDRRRYTPPESSRVCGAPIPRKVRCGRKQCFSGTLTDWGTGEARRHEACAKHEEWYWRLVRENRAARPTDGGALPYANTGGVLAQHFPEVKWAKLWSRLSPEWERLPERVPSAQKPSLTVVVNDEEPGPAAPRKGSGLFAVPELTNHQPNEE